MFIVPDTTALTTKEILESKYLIKKTSGKLPIILVTFHPPIITLATQLVPTLEGDLENLMQSGPMCDPVQAQG